MEKSEILKKLKKEAAVLGLASTALLGGCTANDQQEKQVPVEIMEEVYSNNTFDGSISREELQSKGLDFVFNYNKYERTKGLSNNGEYEYSEWEKKGSYISYIYEADTEISKFEISSISFVEYEPSDDKDENLGKIFVDNEWVPVKNSDLILTTSMILSGDNSRSAIAKYVDPTNYSVTYSNSLEKTNSGKLTEIKIFDNEVKLEYGHYYTEVETENGIELIDSEVYSESVGKGK